MLLYIRTRSRSGREPAELRELTEDFMIIDLNALWLLLLFFLILLFITEEKVLD